MIALAVLALLIALLLGYFTTPAHARSSVVTHATIPTAAEQQEILRVRESCVEPVAHTIFEVQEYARTHPGFEWYRIVQPDGSKKVVTEKEFISAVFENCVYEASVCDPTIARLYPGQCRQK